jgi:hypothetical protein
VRERLFHRECEKDDAHHHRKMQIGVRIPRQRRACFTTSLLEHLPPAHREEVEVRQPERCRGTCEGRGSDAQDRRQQIRVAASRESEQRDVHQVDDQKCRSENEGVVPERIGDGQRRDEHRGHRNQHRTRHTAPSSGLTVFVSQA